MTDLIHSISNYGIMVVICGVFLYNYVQQNKHNREREEKLYKVIEALAAEIPSIKASLDRIESTIHNIKK